MSDFLSEKRKEIQARLKELKPLVDEFHRLEAAERALAGVEDGGGNGASARSTPARRSSGTRRGSGSGSGSGRRGRPKGSGTRGAEALDLVRNRPGITR